MNSMAKRLIGIAIALVALSGIAYGMTINGQLVKAMLENLSSDPTGSTGRLYFNTTSAVPKIYDGVSWTTLGAGSASSGVANLIDNGDAETASVPSGWSMFDDGAVSAPVDGTGGSPATTTAIARTTTAGELISQTGSWKMVKSAANGQGEGWAYDFSFKTKSPLFSSLVSINFDYYFSTASADAVRVYVYDVTNTTVITPTFTTCGGGTAPLLSDVTSSCPAKLSFLATTGTSYRLIFIIAGTGSGAWNFFLDNLYVGAGTTQVGASVGPWVSWTPTGTWIANTTYTGKYRQVGSDMEAQVSVATSGAPTTASLIVNLPTGFTIDTSQLAATSLDPDKLWLGRGSAGTADGYDITVGYSTTTAVKVLSLNRPTTYVQDSLVTQAVPKTFGNGDFVNFSFKVPIVQWAGGTAFGQNTVEYSSNSGTWDAADTTSFSYGPTGNLMGGALTASRSKRVRFLTPISPTDFIQVQVSEDQNVWYPANGGLINALPIIPSTDTSGAIFSGISWDYVSGTATDLDITFGRYINLANDDSPAVAWPSTKAYWRVIKHKAGVPVGFGLASGGSTGLINYYQEDDATLGAVTFAGNVSGAASSAITIRITRVGRTVTLDIPALTTVVPTGGSTRLVSSIALPTWARPSVQRNFLTQSYNNGASVNTTLGGMNVETTGLLNFYRDNSATAYTNSANAGWAQLCITYTVF